MDKYKPVLCQERIVIHIQFAQNITQYLCWAFIHEILSIHICPLEHDLNLNGKLQLMFKKVWLISRANDLIIQTEKVPSRLKMQCS